MPKLPHSGAVVALLGLLVFPGIRPARGAVYYDRPPDPKMESGLIRVWNEKGEMVGGIIGFKDGSLYSPESTFYDNERYPKISIGFSKVASLALTER